MQRENGRPKDNGEYIVIHGGVDAITGPIIQFMANGSSMFTDMGLPMGQSGKFQDSMWGSSIHDGIGPKMKLETFPPIPSLARLDLPNIPTPDELIDAMDQSGFHSEADLRQIIKALEFQQDNPTHYDGVALSHYHVDHIGNMPFIRGDIPYATTEPTKQVMQTMENMRGANWEREYTRYRIRNGESNTRKLQVIERPYIPVEFYEPYKLGAFEVKHIPTSHSAINSSAIEVTYPSGTRVLYTGDIRMGTRTKEEFIPYVTNNPPPDLIFCDGTKVGSNLEGYSEKDVFRIMSASFKRELGTSFVMVPQRQFERLYVIQKAAERNNRKVYIPVSIAVYLHDLQPYRECDPGIPDINDFITYVEPRASGKYSEKDYPVYMRNFIFSDNRIEKVTLEEMKRLKNEKSVVLFSSQSQLLHFYAKNLFPKNGNYIHSTSGAFDASGQVSINRLKRILRELGYAFSAIHSSGHMNTEQLKELLTYLQGILIPIHTENPQEFSQLMRQYAKTGSSTVAHIEKYLPYHPSTMRRARS